MRQAHIKRIIGSQHDVPASELFAEKSTHQKILSVEINGEPIHVTATLLSIELLMTIGSLLQIQKIPRTWKMP